MKEVFPYLDRSTPLKDMVRNRLRFAGLAVVEPAGEAVANIMATFAQLERRLIGQRTREALERKREAGIRLGRPSSIPPDIARRIRSERNSGATFRPK